MNLDNIVRTKFLPPISIMNTSSGIERVKEFLVKEEDGLFTPIVRHVKRNIDFFISNEGSYANSESWNKVATKDKDEAHRHCWEYFSRKIAKKVIRYGTE